MKNVQVKICCCVMLFQIAGIAKSQTEADSSAPFSYAFKYVGEVFTNLHGGLKTGSTFLGMANLTLAFDTKKAGFWKGGMFFINAANTHGGRPSDILVGDFQGVSNIEAGDLSYLHEVWFKQAFNKLSLIIGLQDLNAEFAACDLGGMFINSSFGIHSTIADNVPSPIFPLTRLGAVLAWKHNKNIEFKAGVFDGLLSDYQNNEYNMNWDLKTGEGMLFVGEIVFLGKFINSKHGNYKLGFYNHNHKVAANDEGSYTVENNLGLYVLLEQPVYKNKNNDGGISFFAQMGLSNPDLNNHYAYLGFGMHYCGFSSNRCDDEIGLALAQTWLKKSTNGNETAIELSYKAILGDHFFIQPDFQYIINPAGTDVKLTNSIIGNLRFGINF